MRAAAICDKAEPCDTHASGCCIDDLRKTVSKARILRNYASGVEKREMAGSGKCGVAMGSGESKKDDESDGGTMTKGTEDNEKKADGGGSSSDYEEKDEKDEGETKGTNTEDNEKDNDKKKLAVVDMHVTEKFCG